MKLLAITTSTAQGGVALIEHDRLVALVEHDDGAHHAERIFGLADEALAAAGWSKSALDAIACDIGPGSFTGVRIGLASGKGIAFALGIPLVGIGSLAAMAAAAFAENGDVDRVAPILDARRGECFFAVFDRSGRVLLEPLFLATHAVRDRIAEHDAWAIGRMASEVVQSDRILAFPACELPSAEWVGRLGARLIAKASAGATVNATANTGAKASVNATANFDPGALEPLYVRGPDANLPAIRPDFRRSE